MPRVILICFLVAIAAYANPSKPEAPSQGAYQAAKRAAYLENTRNLPSRGLSLAKRALASPAPANKPQGRGQSPQSADQSLK